MMMECSLGEGRCVKVMMVFGVAGTREGARWKVVKGSKVKL